MLNSKEAEEIALRNLPGWSIKAGVLYNGDYVFVMYDTNNPDSFFDPYRAVDQKTGAFRVFSLFYDVEDPGPIQEMFKDQLVADNSKRNVAKNG